MQFLKVFRLPYFNAFLVIPIRKLKCVERLILFLHRLSWSRLDGVVLCRKKGLPPLWLTWICSLIDESLLVSQVWFWLNYWLLFMERLVEWLDCWSWFLILSSFIWSSTHFQKVCFLNRSLCFSGHRKWLTNALFLKGFNGFVVLGNGRDNGLLVHALLNAAIYPLLHSLLSWSWKWCVQGSALFIASLPHLDLIWF